MMCTTPTPGPGTYDPLKLLSGENATLADMSGEQSSSAFKSTSAQIGKDPFKGGTLPAVGPGAYTPTKGRMGQNATVADMTGEVSSASFASTLVRSLEEWGVPDP